MQLGLTATPKRKDNVDTYKYFGEPVFTYSLKEGINDGFLTPFRVKQIQTTLDEYIYTPDDSVMVGEVEAGKRYEEKDFNRIIEITERERKRVQIFMEQNSNLDKPFKLILHRVGLVPWPKLFQNMRASCETEWLNEGHPAHVVAAWIGHSVKVQRDSYAQITDGHYTAFNSHLVQTSKGGHTGGPEGAGTFEKPQEISVQQRGPLSEKHQKNAENTGFLSKIEYPRQESNLWPAL